MDDLLRAWRHQILRPGQLLQPVQPQQRGFLKLQDAPLGEQFLLLRAQRFQFVTRQSSRHARRQQARKQNQGDRSRADRRPASPARLRIGLPNEAVYAAHLCLSIPTHAGYGSLNLAQAVQILAYEWRQALGGFPVVARTRTPVEADAAAVQGLLAHWREMLVEIGFLDPQVPRKLMPRLQQLLHRARVTTEEVHILRGIARQVQKFRGGAGP